MQKRKRITQKDFQRKIQVWTLLITLIVAVVGSLTAICIAYVNRPNAEYIMSHDDQLEVNKLSAQINLLLERYFATQDQTEKNKLDAELRVLAETEATIMRKYNPNYQPRWPLVLKASYGLRTPVILIALGALIMMSVGMSAHYALKRIWSAKYRKELVDAYVIETIRHNSRRHRETSSDLIHHANYKYKPEEIECALRRLEVEREIQNRNGLWFLEEDVRPDGFAD